MVWVMLAVFLGICFAWVLLCTIFMLYGARKQPHSEQATVLVLGCKVKENQPGLHLSKRIEAAAQYLKQHPSANCIGTGGKGRNEWLPEGEVIVHTLMQKGIEPERLLAEVHSVNTMENLQFAKRILEEQGWQKECVLVTDSFHQFRANRMAKQIGLETSAINAKRTWHTLFLNYPREVMAITKLLLFQWKPMQSKSSVKN